MRFWLIAVGLFASGALLVIAGWILRRLNRPEIEPVTKQWLAEAASREDHVC
ncbi:MAG TPA: hypothetical protein VHJ58_20180 [Vicinamibacterales bacterium]|jgi:hypothetical protein|nr:hypothetical protein [Vicinamibacterales bacterium]